MTDAERKIDIRGKVTPNELGAPQVLLTKPVDILEHVMGQIWGYATGKTMRTVVDQVTQEKREIWGMTGQFQAIPADETKSIVRSGVCWLPEGLVFPLLGAITAAKGQPVTFGLELYVFRANNPAKYSWGARNLVEANVDDPLSRLVATRGSDIQAITHDPETGEVAVSEEPVAVSEEPVAGKHKDKHKSK